MRLRLASATLLLAFLAVAVAVAAADTVDDWLDAAANPAFSRRQREFAYRQVLMLSDASAARIFAALRGEDSDSSLRRQVAARLLGELGPPAAEPPLLEAAFGRDPFLAEAASGALARIYARLDGERLAELLDAGGGGILRWPDSPAGSDGDWLGLVLASAEAKSRFRALVMRGLTIKAGGGWRIPELLLRRVWDGLLDSERELRLRSVQAAAVSASDYAPERLAAFLYAENDPVLLIAALRAMAEMRPPDHGEAVERQTAHADPLVAIEALAALDAMGYEGAMFPAFPGARAAAVFVSHPSTPVRRRAIELLDASRSPSALEYLRNALFDRVGANRAAAARALGDLGLAGASGYLTPLLGDGWPEARAEAAVALTRLGTLGAAPRLLDDLADGPLPFRRAAAQALGRMGEGRALAALAAALDDPDLELACLAAEALGRLGGDEAVRRLFARLAAAGDPVLADAIRQTLGRLCRETPGLSPAEMEAWARRNLR